MEANTNFNDIQVQSQLNGSKNHYKEVINLV